MPVVLVHGLAVSHRYLMPLAAQLAARYPVHAVDLPGFGLSDDPGQVLDVPELADRLAEWLVLADVSPAAVVAHSFGCQVAVDLAVRYPTRVTGLLLVGPTIDPYARTALRQVLRLLRDLWHEDLTQLPIFVRDLADAGLARAAGTFRIALRDRIEHKLPAVPVATLVTRGGLEPTVSRRWVELAARLLPRGELAVVPGAPHDAGYTAAERLAAVLIPFLDRLSAPSDR